MAGEVYGKSHRPGDGKIPTTPADCGALTGISSVNAALEHPSRAWEMCISNKRGRPE